MDNSIKRVEKILNYNFKNKKLLEMALTHSSYTKGQPYERLEFLGDAALGSTIINFAYLTYPNLDADVLSLVRSANVSTEKLARVSVNIGLYKYVRHNAPYMEDKVKRFIDVVQEQRTISIYGGLVTAPKILADIVESVVGAIFEDLQFDLKATWHVIGGLLEPIITPDMLEKQPQPITKLFELCQKIGHEVEIKESRENHKTRASVYIDGKFIVSASSEQRERAKLYAAMAALERTTQQNDSLPENVHIGVAKRKLGQISLNKKWSKPTYSVVKEIGPPHAKTFICSVSFTIGDDLFCEKGEEKSRKKDAEGCAAQAMLMSLQEKNLI